MAKDYSAHQQGIIKRYYEHQDTIMLQRLSEIVSDLYLAEGKKAVKLWDSARGALMRIAGQDPRVIEVLRERSVEKLAKLVGDLNAGVVQGSEGSGEAGPEPVQPSRQEGESATPQAALEETISSEQLKGAMKAFRKRLKLTRLDDESRLARSPMSSGKSSEIAAIMPPRDFPQPVWDELVRQGKLRPVGKGFYELAGER